MNSDILDGILTQTQASLSAAPRVLAEQHDLSKINIEGEGPAAAAGELPSAGLARQIASLERDGGWWDDAEYGMSRAQRVAELKLAHAKALAYETSPEGLEKARQAAEVARLAMVARAVERAGLDTTGGKVALVVAGAKALAAHWTKLGVSVSDALCWADAERLANLGWS